MDFFESQDRARRRTRVLVVYFALAVAMIIAAIYGVLLAGQYYGADYGLEMGESFSLWQPDLFLIVAAGVVLLVGIGSGWKTMQLSAGGGVVARDLGGQPLSLDPSDPDERKLRNVVEEMALASGSPVPEIYLLNDEKGINAFAAGHTPSDSAIGVTRGCVQLLSRDELQGVIAHEFSHILNGDMRLSTRLIGVLHGILLIAILGRVFLRSMFYAPRRSSREKGGGAMAFALFGLALLIIGYVGVFFGKLIKSAVSRQREFLADASAVQFTRNPEGIGGALKKIGGFSEGSRIETPKAEEASHLFFANGMANSLAGLLATHPPLPERIRAVDPGWDGKFLKPRREVARAETSERKKTPPPLGGIPGGMMGTVILGGLSAAQMAEGRRLHGSIPDVIARELHDPMGAATVVLALLISHDAATQERQLGTIRKFSEPAAQAAVRLSPVAKQVESRLALAELVIPALRALSPAQYAVFREALTAVVEADEQIDLFEFAVQKMVRRHLGVHFGDFHPPAIRYRSAKPLARAIETVLSTLAHAGGGDVDAAFERGAVQVSGLQGALELQPPERRGLGPLDEALDQLAAAAPMVKKNVLYAGGQTVMEDRTATSQEKELLRAIADTLDAPMPPL